MQCLFGQPLAGGLGDPEVDDLGRGTIALNRHEDVRRFQVPMNDALLVRVLHTFANIDEKLQPLANRETLVVAVLRNRLATHELHREIRTPQVRRACVEDLRDGGMIHQR